MISSSVAILAQATLFFSGEAFPWEAMVVLVQVTTWNREKKLIPVHVVTTIHDLKVEIQRKEGIPAAQQRLSYTDVGPGHQERKGSGVYVAN